MFLLHWGGEVPAQETKSKKKSKASIWNDTSYEMKWSLLMSD